MHLVFLVAVTPSHLGNGEYTQDAVLSCDMIISLRSDLTSRVCPTLMPQFGEHDLIYLNRMKRYIYCSGRLAAVPRPSWNPSGGRPLRNVGWNMCHFISLENLRHIILILAKHADFWVDDFSQFGLSVQHFCPVLNILINIGWAASKCSAEINGPLMYLLFSWLLEHFKMPKLVYDRVSPKNNDLIPISCSCTLTLALTQCTNMQC